MRNANRDKFQLSEAYVSGTLTLSKSQISNKSQQPKRKIQNRFENLDFEF